MKDNTQIATQNQALAIPNFSPEQVEIIKNTVAKGVSDMELQFFLALAASVGLNPFKKEIWCYKDNKGNVLMFAGRDGFLSAAQKQPVFNGMRSSYVCEKDKFSIDIPNGRVDHSFGTSDRGAIIGAWCLAFRKQQEPTLEWVDFNVYNKGYNAWKSHPGAMIQKVAEATALKKAFGLSGFDIEESYDFQNDTFKSVEDIKEHDPIIQIPPQIEEIPDEVEHLIAICKNKEQTTAVWNDKPELQSNPKFLQLIVNRNKQIKNA